MRFFGLCVSSAGFAIHVNGGAIWALTHFELTDYLGYEKHDRAGCKSGNTGNSKTSKKLKGDFGACFSGCKRPALFLPLPPYR